MNYFKLIFIFLSSICSANLEAIQPEDDIIMKADIMISSVNDSNSSKIIPGQPVKLKALVKNSGSKKSLRSKIQVIYDYTKPLKSESEKPLYTSKVVEIPEIEPGKSFLVEFDTPHKLPSIADFITEDWALREYQAVLTEADTPKIIGSLAITFSAYYYPAVHKEIPNKF